MKMCNLKIFYSTIMLPEKTPDLVLDFLPQHQSRVARKEVHPHLWYWPQQISDIHPVEPKLHRRNQDWVKQPKIMYELSILENT